MSLPCVVNSEVKVAFAMCVRSSSRLNEGMINIRLIINKGNQRKFCPKTKKKTKKRDQDLQFTGLCERINRHHKPQAEKCET